MASEDKKAGTSEFTGILAVLALFFSAVWVEYAPLTTSRPPPEEIPESAQSGVTARLWQDPFTAVQRQLTEQSKNLNDEICSNERPGAVLEKLVQENKAKDIKTIALSAMIEEANWASVEELQGRRQRYAVLAALNRFDYLPDAADTLKCLKFSESRENQPPLIIPYELFSRTGPDASKTQVALFWLNEAVINREPLRWIRTLFQSQADAGTIRILGPLASGTVRNLVNEVQALDQKDGTEDSLLPLNRLAFLSSSATAADRNLLPAGSSDQSLSAFLNSKKVFFERLTSTDDRLVRALADELALRGLNRQRLDEDKAYVALVSEWDTLYAQTLPKTFKAALGVEKRCENHADTCPVLEFSYLRGLDGFLPGKGGANTGGERQNNKESRKDGSAVEKPEGDSQTDYLRRLTDRLSEQERLLHDQGKELQAIGVFGNDIYDKLLVLKALRFRFPGKIIFTTDLDAAYLHPEQFKPVTHNLIVASAFGLTLNPYLQGRIAPFRDSYQTGTFLAAQVALNLDQFGGSLDKPDRGIEIHDRTAKWFLEHGPRIFEIGRTEAVSLNNPADGQSEHCALTDCLNVHPVNDTWLDKSDHYSDRIYRLIGLYICVILLASLLWLLLSLLWHGARRATRNAWRWLGRHPAAGTAGIIALLAVVAWINYLAFLDEDQEPVSWVDGISMWPAELIRLTTLLLAIILGWRGWRLIRWNEIDISKRFFPNVPHRLIFPRTQTKQTLSDAMKDYWRKITRDKPDPHNALAIWIEHVNPRSAWAWWLRSAIPAILFILFSAIMLWISWGLPEGPYRGEAFGKLDRVIFLVTLIAVQLLIFFVAEATSRCNRMAQQLKKTPNWPPATLTERGLTDGSARELCGRSFHQEHHASIFDPLLDMELIAERTEILGGLIYYPFVALAFFIASRSSLFDNWYTPWPLLLLFLLSFAIPMICALRLRANAENLRKIALEKLSKCMLALKGTDNTGQSCQLEEAIRQVNAMDKGVFKPFSEQPWVRALLLPLGSWSSFTILEFFIRTAFS